MPQDIEKWRAREGTGLNFVLLYIYKTVAGLFYYKVFSPLPQATFDRHCSL